MESPNRKSNLRVLLLVGVGLMWPAAGAGQANCVARFALEKKSYLAGEPIFCNYVLKNMGGKPVRFSYRFPRRAVNPDLEQEPRFRVTDAAGHRLADPAPRPCGGARGSVVYGWATLGPGETHTERWLLNEWARLDRPGSYRVRAERRLPVVMADSTAEQGLGKPAAFPLALNELSFRVEAATEEQLQAAFRPYLNALDHGAPGNVPEAVLVLTTLPKSYFLTKLQTVLATPARDGAWDRKQILEGLARLGTPPAWETILQTAQRTEPVATRSAKVGRDDLALRSHAILLLGQKRDRTMLPVLLRLAENSPPEIRGSVLQTLGFFDDPRAAEALFAKLHAADASERVNAILGLRNRGNKDVVPALLAMLNDAAPEVRQVANFSLQRLTGQRFTLSAQAAGEESARVAARWRAWWREHGATFVPVAPPPCRDW